MVVSTTGRLGCLTIMMTGAAEMVGRATDISDRTTEKRDRTTEMVACSLSIGTFGCYLCICSRLQWVAAYFGGALQVMQV